MRKIRSQARLGIALVVVCSIFISCTTNASSKYWGKIEVPQDNVMRYITGSEPESLDPAFVTGQPEARIMVALYDRLVEYHPKTMEPIPAMATHWETDGSLLNYTFYLRKNGKFSNGDPIKAQDFVYSIRRALSPELASRYAFIGYDIKYAEAYNAAKSFVKKDGEFLLAKDFSGDGGIATSDTGSEEGASSDSSDGDSSDFQKFINSSERLTISPPTSDKAKEELGKITKDNPKLKAALEGAEFVPVKSEDIGIEAVDDYTVRITLKQTAPYFVGMLPHQFFAVLHKPTIEEHGKDWIKSENIVTSGPFKVEFWNPYDELAVEKDPNYWDSENVKLDGIRFYPMDEQTTMMNIYKSGRVDALYNHTVPAAWNEYIRQFKDEYLLHPEITIEYYTFSVKKPPVDKVEVRRAFALAVDREALEKYRKTVKRSADFTPPGIFPKYEEARKKVYAEKIKEAGISAEEFEKRLYNPQKACEYMKEAGYTVKMRGEQCDVSDFPADDIQLSYNTAESNKQVAEFVQQQWKQNLGITVQLKNMEWKTYLKYRSAVEYNGIARAGWVGDYMDPFTFLSQFYTEKNDSSTGWWDPKFDRMMDDANQTRDLQERLEKLAAAEFYLLQDQPMMPLSVAGTSWMKKPYMKGMYPNPQTIHPWKFVYIEKDRTKWDKNVDNIMKESDPQIEAEIEALMKTQKDFEVSKDSGSEESSDLKDIESIQADEE